MGKVINFRACDNLLMFKVFKQMVHQTEENIFYYDGMQDVDNPGVQIDFRNMEHTYEIFNILSTNWGGWNKCPEAIVMYTVARKWEEMYGTEIIDIGYDVVDFSLTRDLSDEEIDALIVEIKNINADANYTGGFIELRNCIKEDLKFSIGWD